MSTAFHEHNASLETQLQSRPWRTESRNQSPTESFVSRLFSTDFCPQFNRYLYWLKEPVGWFLLAATASVMVGAFLSPIGWTLAAGLVALIVAGLALPWIAIRFTDCTLEPVISEINEHETSQLMLTVHNRLPVPLWGLMVEGYLAAPIVQTGLIGDASLESDTVPDVGLACVPPLCNATFRLSVRPENRGFYPVEAPEMTCAFPFGIWTARRKIENVKPVTVWPKRIDLSGLLDTGGAKNADEGIGERVGTIGDFQGVRAFRRGDSLRSIHWVQTARLDSLVVCDRTAPQRQTVALELDTQSIDGNQLAARDHLAWRIRIVASLAELLCARHVAFQLVVDNETHKLSGGKRGLKQALDLLAAIPLDHRRASTSARDVIAGHLTTRICIGLPKFSSNSQRCLVGLSISQPSTGFRSHEREHTVDIDLNSELAAQLNHFLSEASHACFAA